MFTYSAHQHCLSLLLGFFPKLEVTCLDVLALYLCVPVALRVESQSLLALLNLSPSLGEVAATLPSHIIGFR